MVYTQPRGRPRKGCWWDSHNGRWVKASSVRSTTPPTASCASADAVRQATERREEELRRQREQEEAERAEAEWRRAEAERLQAEARAAERRERATETYAKSLQPYLPPGCHVYYMTPAGDVYDASKPRRTPRPLGMDALLAQSKPAKRARLVTRKVYGPTDDLAAGEWEYREVWEE